MRIQPENKPNLCVKTGVVFDEVKGERFIFQGKSDLALRS